MVLVYYTLLDKQIPAACEQHWLDELAPALRTRMQRLRAEQQRLTSLLGLQLLKHAATELKLSNFALRDLDYPNKGKPRWHAPLDFNISHSHQLVVCAATTVCRVGIDVERVREFHAAVPRRMFDEAEQKRVKQSQDAFFEIWTAKEAAIKACGRGIGVLSRVHTSAEHAVLEAETLYLKPLDLTQAYRAHLATDKQAIPLSVQMLPLDELCNMTLVPAPAPNTGPPHDKH